MEASLKFEKAREMHDSLMEIAKYLEHLEEPFLSLENLRNMKIKTSLFDLHSEHDIDFDAQFCRPFPADEFDKAFEIHAKEKGNRLTSRNYSLGSRRIVAARDNIFFFNHIVDDMECYGVLKDRTNWVGRSAYFTYQTLSSSNYHRIPFDTWEMAEIRHALPLPRRAQTPRGKNSGSNNQGHRSFNAKEVTDVARPGSVKPHIACSLASDYPADDGKLLCCEMLAAVSMMVTHVRQKALWDFYVHPVFVYSFTGDEARVLQIHFDVTSDTLFVRMSPFIHVDSQTPLGDWKDDMAFQQNEENIKLLLRWMINDPIGDTGYRSLPQQDEVSEPLQDHPPTPSKRSLKVA